MSETKMQKIGYFVQLGGIGAVGVGSILSLHHLAIGAFFVSGLAAFFVGKKVRGLA